MYKKWAHQSTTTSSSRIVPDGCRDILLIDEPHANLEIRFTRWDDRVRVVNSTIGESIVGYRLKPGISLSPAIVKTISNQLDDLDEILLSENQSQSEIAEMVRALATANTTLLQVARSEGVSVRTLQRRFEKMALPVPDFWRLLARVRCAANALSAHTTLGDIAATFGFSDQSHMSREFVRWFGVTPKQLQADHQLRFEIAQPGLGNWG